MDLSKNLKSLGLTLVMLCSSAAHAQWNENEAVIRDDSGHEVTITPGSHRSDCNVLDMGKGTKKGYYGICKQRLRQLKRNERVARRNGVASTTSSYTAKNDPNKYYLSSSRARNPNGIYIPQYCRGRSGDGGCSNGPVIKSSTNISATIRGKRMRFDDYDLEDGLRSCDDFIGEVNEWRDSSDYKKSKNKGKIADLKLELKVAKEELKEAEDLILSGKGPDGACGCEGLFDLSSEVAKVLTGCAVFGTYKTGEKDSDGNDKTAISKPTSCADLWDKNAKVVSQGVNRTSHTMSITGNRVNKDACREGLLTHFKTGCAKSYWVALAAVELAESNLDEAKDEMKEACSIASDGDFNIPTLEDALEYGRDCVEAVRYSCESLWAQVGDVSDEGCANCREQYAEEESSSRRSGREEYVYTDHCASFGEYSQSCYSNVSSTGPGQYASCAYPGAPGCSQQWCTAGMNCTTATGQNMVNAQGQVVQGSQQQMSPWATAATTVGAVVAQGAFGLAQANRNLWGQRSYYDAVTAANNNSLQAYQDQLAVYQGNGSTGPFPTYTGGVPVYAGNFGYNTGWGGIGLGLNGINGGFNGFNNGLNGQFANNGAIQQELMMMQQGQYGNQWGGNNWGNTGWAGGNQWGNQWGGNGYGYGNGIGFRIPSFYMGVQ